VKTAVNECDPTLGIVVVLATPVAASTVTGVPTRRP